MGEHEFDPSVWTSEPLSQVDLYWVRHKNPHPGEARPFTAEINAHANMVDYERSTHPIPSAEVLAAMHEVCDEAKAFKEEPWRFVGGDETNWSDLLAALAKLTAAKEARRG